MMAKHQDSIKQQRQDIKKQIEDHKEHTASVLTKTKHVLEQGVINIGSEGEQARELHPQQQKDLPVEKAKTLETRASLDYLPHQKKVQD